MRIHFHSVSWNEKRMLEFFFRHYEPWVDKFVIHDDGSDDGTRELLESREDVELAPFPRSHPESFVLSAKTIYDTSWHTSIGEADWVVVANIDEHMFHPDMRGYLADMLEQGVTAVSALGYQMISREYPPSGSTLWRDLSIGAPWKQMSKMQIFQPAKIGAATFSPGRHRAFFPESPKIPERDSVLNLHYKYLGETRTFERQQREVERHGPMDRAKNWNHPKLLSRDAFSDRFQSFVERAVDIHSIEDHNAFHQEPRWWRP